MVERAAIALAAGAAALNPGQIVIPNKEKPEPVNNTELVTAFRAQGGGILHIRPGKFGDRTSRGLTFAFIVKGSRMQIATAVQHRNDSFTKKLGTKTAIEHFLAGQTVHLPINKHDTPHRALTNAAYMLVG